MFTVLLLASFLGNTVSLYASSFDNLGDAITYGVSIWAIDKSDYQKAKVSLLKGALILLGAVSVLVTLVYKWLTLSIPTYEVMGGFSILSLMGNLSCLALLWRHRKQDINMESVWHCSRNDLLTDLSIILATALVWYYNSWIPDFILGSILVIFLVRSGIIISRKSLKQARESTR